MGAQQRFSPSAQLHIIAAKQVQERSALGRVFEPQRLGEDRFIANLMQAAADTTLLDMGQTGPKSGRVNGSSFARSGQVGDADVFF
jgi:hypothetical protein